MRALRSGLLSFFCLVSFLAASLFLGRPALSSPLPSAGRAPNLTEVVYRNSGGWGLSSVVIASITSIASEHRHALREGRDFDGRAAFAFMGNPAFWKGVAGDLVATHVVSAVLPALPGGVFVHTFARVMAGFVGFELGSGRYRHSDWGLMTMQGLVATAVQLGGTAVLSAAGLPFAGFVAGGLAIGAAMGVAYLFEHLKNSSVHAEAVERETGPDKACVDVDFTGTSAGGLVRRDKACSDAEAMPSGTLDGPDMASLARERDKAYRRWLRLNHRGADRGELSRALDEFRRLDERLRDSLAGRASSR